MNKKLAHISNETAILKKELKRFHSINDVIQKWATKKPNCIALSGPSQNYDWQNITWQNLNKYITLISKGLLFNGIKKGDHVGILSTGHSYIDCIVAYYALAKIGAVMVPLNYRFTDHELINSINHAECCALIFENSLLERAVTITNNCTKVEKTISLGSTNTLKNTLNLNDFLMHKYNDIDLPKIYHSDLLNLIYTSGTTGSPKAVMHTHGSGLATGIIFSKALDLQKNDIFHHAIPFFTSSGTQFIPMASLWAGCTLMLESEFNAKKMLKNIESKKSTAVIGVPSHYLFMLEELKNKPYKIDSVRLWDYGGAAMPQSAIHKIAEIFPNSEQRQQYGMTETGPSGTILMPEYTFEHIGTIGTPMPMCQVKVVNDDNQTLNRNQIGNIQIKSPARMLGYFKNAQKTAETLLKDGWIHTGDEGWIDNDGFLHFSDRSVDVINRGGLKISSIEIEELLYKHPSVHEVAVVPIKHEKLGQDIVAVIVLRADSDIKDIDLYEFCCTQIARYKAPRKYKFTHELPKNAMGKIDKQAIIKTIYE